MARIPVGVAGIIALSCCVPASTPAPSPQPVPQPVPPPRPAPPVVVTPPPVSTSWQDLPLTAGAWAFDAAALAARYGQGAASRFTLRCDRAARQVALSVSGASAGVLTIRTSSLARTLPLGTDGQARLPVNDPLLDAIAFSRGRFAVEAPGIALVIPAWPEPARVVEECRS